MTQCHHLFGAVSVFLNELTVLFSYPALGEDRRGQDEAIGCEE